ncbi:MAG: class I SAM-dependent methyltransferase [Calditrichaeota bacterium]|nr:class I SAM-dependent methyltransferase [Candidatus Cloacimonadota bacterium]MCA9784967.1 class I SAM-dependent methyltransferase [Candidatus Cloacimonadota bacterium]MCB1047155.1 class I SAM-dependent methyltransferase [Calditrichota bacterium]MCB9472578.1 class I SAM-dependent methyltransferase [Candidatus Delongbacteria bacterium]
MSRGQQLTLIGSWKAEVDYMASLILSVPVESGESMRILEAGCGRKWPFNFSAVPHHLTGVDLDAMALQIRAQTLGDLHEAIVGDLCTVDLGENKFHVIYCSFVLEHIPEARKALENLIRSTRQGGVIIVKVPDPVSVQGFVTRWTPHWFHVLYYRHILRNPNAGKPGHGPYPTHYTPVISRPGIRQFCDNSEGRVAMEMELGDGYSSPGKGLRGKLIWLAKSTFWMLSLGRLSRTHTDLLFVMRKANGN